MSWLARWTPLIRHLGLFPIFSSLQGIDVHDNPVCGGSRVARPHWLTAREMFSMATTNTTLIANAQVRLPRSPAVVPGPSSRTAVTAEYVHMVGRMAYIWGYPLVNSHNRRKGFARAPECGRNGGVLPIAPVGRNTMLTDYIKPQQTFVTCPNQDVVYGAGYYALDQEPIVFRVPDFGSRFWVYALYDARTDEFFASPRSERARQFLSRILQH